jgi:hypothetical protein
LIEAGTLSVCTERHVLGPLGPPLAEEPPLLDELPSPLPEELPADELALPLPDELMPPPPAPDEPLPFHPTVPAPVPHAPARTGSATNEPRAITFTKRMRCHHCRTRGALRLTSRHSADAGLVSSTW